MKFRWAHFWILSEARSRLYQHRFFKYSSSVIIYFPSSPARRKRAEETAAVLSVAEKIKVELDEFKPSAAARFVVLLLAAKARLRLAIQNCFRQTRSEFFEFSKYLFGKFTDLRPLSGITAKSDKFLRRSVSSPGIKSRRKMTYFAKTQQHVAKIRRSDRFLHHNANLCTI